MNFKLPIAACELSCTFVAWPAFWDEMGRRSTRIGFKWQLNNLFSMFLLPLLLSFPSPRTQNTMHRNTFCKKHERDLVSKLPLEGIRDHASFTMCLYFFMTIRLLLFSLHKVKMMEL